MAAEVSTSSAPERDAACRQARALASDTGIPGPCECRARGPVFFCSVTAVVARPPRSLLEQGTGAAKDWTRELLKCRNDDADCVRTHRPNVTTGVRG